MIDEGNSNGETHIFLAFTQILQNPGMENSDILFKIIYLFTKCQFLFLKLPLDPLLPFEWQNSTLKVCVVNLTESTQHYTPLGGVGCFSDTKKKRSCSLKDCVWLLLSACMCEDFPQPLTEHNRGE